MTTMQEAVADYLSRYHATWSEPSIYSQTQAFFELADANLPTWDEHDLLTGGEWEECENPF